MVTGRRPPLFLILVLLIAVSAAAFVYRGREGSRPSLLPALIPLPGLPGHNMDRTGPAAVQDALAGVRAAVAREPVSFYAVTGEIITAQRRVETSRLSLSPAQGPAVAEALACYARVTDAWQRDRQATLADRWRSIRSVDELYSRRIREDCAAPADSALRTLS